MEIEGSDGSPGACASMAIVRFTLQNGLIAPAAFGRKAELPAAKISVAGPGSGGGLGAGGVAGAAGFAAGGGAMRATTGTGAGEGAGAGAGGKGRIAATTTWRCTTGVRLIAQAR